MQFGREGEEDFVSTIARSMDERGFVIPRSSDGPSRSGNPPASERFVKRLPHLKISKEIADSKEPCVVCSERFKVLDDVIKLPCRHIFHPDCIHPWLQKVPPPRLSPFLLNGLTAPDKYLPHLPK